MKSRVFEKAFSVLLMFSILCPVPAFADDESAYESKPKETNNESFYGGAGVLMGNDNTWGGAIRFKGDPFAGRTFEATLGASGGGQQYEGLMGRLVLGFDTPATKKFEPVFNFVIDYQPKFRQAALELGGRRTTDKTYFEAGVVPFRLLSDRQEKGLGIAPGVKVAAGVKVDPVLLEAAVHAGAILRIQSRQAGEIKGDWEQQGVGRYVEARVGAKYFFGKDKETGNNDKYYVGVDFTAISTQYDLKGRDDVSADRNAESLGLTGVVSAGFKF